MNGCQFAVRTYMNPMPITRKMTASLMKTMMLLKRADSLMPMTRIAVITRARNAAVTLKIAPVRVK